MRYAIAFFVLAFCGGLTASAQVLPSSNGSCGISSDGTTTCSWLSGTRPTKADGGASSVSDGRPELFVTRFVLAPGAPLDSRAIVGGEVLIVSRGIGEIVNEKKSPPAQVDVFENLVMLMPKEEPYLLRNVGKKNLELLVIEVRK